MRNAPSSAEWPVIGLTPDELISPDGSTVFYGQRDFYSQAFEEAGAVPQFAPVLNSPEAIEAIYERYDGIVITGGLDVNPSLYGEQALYPQKVGSMANDKMARHLIELAQRDGKPLLAICRGMQLWNVVSGGELYQHLPDQFDTDVDHLNAKKDTMSRHVVEVKRPSRLGNIVMDNLTGQNTVDVNSYHHQGIKVLGSGLAVVGRAPDGLIEAVETTNPNWWAVGVQWHPESVDSIGILEDFRDASIAYRQQQQQEELPPQLEAVA